jgi:hypothetical protein
MLGIAPFINQTVFLNAVSNLPCLPAGRLDKGGMFPPFAKHG